MYVRIFYLFKLFQYVFLVQDFILGKVDVECKSYESLSELQ